MAKKIILVLGALLLVMALAGYYIANRRYEPEDLSAFEYPGSQRKDTDSFALRLPPRDRARLVKAVVYVTDDPPEKVIAHYKEKLGANTRSLNVLSRGKPTGLFDVEIGDRHKFIMVTSNEDTEKTEILISSVLPAAFR